MLNVLKNATDNRLHWEQIIHSFSHPKKFRLRIIDTVFLNRKEASGTPPQITSWHFTTKKGEINRRKDASNLTLQHVHDRFCRLALAGTNATGARIVAIGYLESGTEKKRIHFTAEQMEREVKTRKGIPFGGCSYLQCYLHPYQGKDHSFRGVYTSQLVPTSSSAGKEMKKDIMVYLIEDPLISTHEDHRQKRNHCSSTQEGIEQTIALSGSIQEEIDGLMLTILESLESLEKKRRISGNSKLVGEDMIIRFSADFLLDEDKKLWLAHVDNVAFRSDDISRCEMNYNSDENPFLPHVQVSPRSNFSSSKRSDQSGVQAGRDSNVEHPNLQHSIKACEESGELPSITSGVQISVACDVDHSVQIENKIIRLKEELDSKTKAKQEHSSKISALRSEVQSSLNFSEGERQVEAQARQDQDRNDTRNQNDITLEDCKNMSTESSSLAFDNDFEEVENELKVVREENGLLHNFIADRKQHDEIIVRLEKQCSELARKLKHETFHKNEANREIGGKLEEAFKALNKSKGQTELLEIDMTNKQDCHEIVVRQLKSTNKVLEAELQSQKEYVDELRSNTWTEVVAKVKAGVEAVTSQEMAKSSMGVAKAVTACEDRWRKRLEEVNVAHIEDISRLREENKQELRYKQSQFLIQIEEVRAEVENRLQKQHTESMRAKLNHKESQRQLDVNNEMKRWEQMMLEMKARLSSEFQQNKQKVLKERDSQWKSKLDRKSREAALSLQEDQNRSRKLLQETRRQNEIDVNIILSKVEEAKEFAAKEARDLAEKESLARLQEQKKEFDEAWRLERETLMKKCKEESALHVTQAVEKEHKMFEELRKTIAEMNIEHKEDIENLKHTEEDTQKDTVRLIESRVKERESFLTQTFERKAEKMKRDCEAIVEEMKKVEETRFENVWSEANETITTQIASIKEESKKDTEKMANEVELDHENQIQSLEYETGWLKNQKETADDTIEALRNTLSKKEDQMREMEEEMNSERGCHSYHKLFLITKALQLQQEIKSKDAVHTKKIERINQQHSESEKRLCAKADMLEQRSSKFEGNMKLISSTLLNHKRDALLEHKAKSREVATRLNEVSEKIQTVDAKRQKEKSFVDNLVQAMHDVEKQLQDHSQTSALQGGKINISHARKKRRLDEEYEQILNKIELRRDELNGIDEEGKRLQMERTAANDKMRTLEKSLVELLVEQQKTLLSISTRGKATDSRGK